MGPAEFIATVRKGKPAPVYFLRGLDRFLHEECRRALIESVPPQAREWCLSDVEFQPGRLAKELEGADQIPMLGSRNYFFFSDPEDFGHSTDEDAEALRVYLERPSPFSTVIFAAVDPDRRRRFIQLLEKNAGLVELRPPGRREAAAWTDSRVTIAVVRCPLLRLGQDAVGLRNFLELFFRSFCVVRVAVGMILKGELPVGALDLLLRRVPAYPQDFVIVSFPVQLTTSRGRPCPMRDALRPFPARRPGRSVHSSRSAFVVRLLRSCSRLWLSRGNRDLDDRWS